MVKGLWSHTKLRKHCGVCLLNTIFCDWANAVVSKQSLAGLTDVPFRFYLHRSRDVSRNECCIRHIVYVSFMELIFLLISVF